MYFNHQQIYINNKKILVKKHKNIKQKTVTYKCTEIMVCP